METNNVAYKRTETSKIEFGLYIKSYIFTKDFTGWKILILDKNLQEVSNIYAYYSFDILLNYNKFGKIKCKNFYMDGYGMTVRIFKDDTFYPVIFRNERGVKILDEKLNITEIDYDQNIYSNFQLQKDSWEI